MAKQGAKLSAIFKNRHQVWFFAPAVTVLILTLRALGWLQGWELNSFDALVRSRPPEAPDSRIVIVGIDELDLRNLGQWPFPDEHLAQLLRQVEAQEPAAIGLDLYRDLPVRPGHDELVAVFQNTPNLIGIELVAEHYPAEGVAPPPALAANGQVGFNNVVVDPDGKLRRAVLSMVKDQEPVASFAMVLASLYLEAQGIRPESDPDQPLVFHWGEGTVRPFTGEDGGYAGVDAGGYQILLNYRGRGGSFETVPMRDVLRGTIAPDLFRDRIVLIGATAMSLNDFFYTPYSGDRITTPERTAGVEIQANMISHLLALALEGRPGITTLPVWGEWLWVGLFSLLGVGISWRQQRERPLGQFVPPWGWVQGGVATALILASTVVAFQGWGLWLPVVPGMLGLWGGAIAVTLYTAQLERRERQTVMNLFGRHVTPKVAEAIWRDRDHLLKSGRLPGQKVTATVLFSDLKGFSTIAEAMAPEALMAWLNDYMGEMTDVVLDQGGIVDKFIGDAIMAVFGVPIARETEAEIRADAIAAVQCALIMARKLERLNQYWQANQKPRTAIRIGIATGRVVAGSLGSHQRLDYTTIGDTVNIAARLESLNKLQDHSLCRILINQETYDYVRDCVDAQWVGKVNLRGRGRPSDVYQVIYHP